MMKRRHFLQALAAVAAAPPGGARASRHSGFGALQADPQRILDLPAGFRYDIVSRHGDEMDDGLLVPALADGMAAFPGGDGQVLLVCNHENAAFEPEKGPYGPDLARWPAVEPAAVYDRGRGRSPGNGGTTTIAWDPVARRRRRQHMSLLGTEINCAGGATPWGSWLSCEECFTDPGSSFERGRVIHRERRHGYVFEVPAGALSPVAPQPLLAMGRFEHEAAAVDPRSGIVYLSEDRNRSLFYRYVPERPGRLADGGRLQALAIAGRPSLDTRNWERVPLIAPGDRLDAEWLDLPDVDGASNDLRLRGYELGAARFARGEGLAWADGEVVLTATTGGAERLGQVWSYRPDPLGSGHADERGSLRLLAEATRNSLLRHADNLTLSPWGDLVVCEDTAEHCGLVGLRPDGRQYPLADNAYSPSELAGVCFSPDGSELFVNIQSRGLTLAIRGPWPHPG